MIIFGRSVAKKVRNQSMIYFPLSYLVLLHYPAHKKCGPMPNVMAALRI